MLIASVSGYAWAQVSGDNPAPAAASLPVAKTDADRLAGVNDSTNSTFGELRQMMQDQSVSELRTTYNGSYGASLLFQKDERNYYVALFQGKKFWRVVKTASDTQAGRIYQSFVRQSEKLAKVENRRIKLEADMQFTERQIAAGQTRLLVLQNDAAIRQQQEKIVSAQQEQARGRAQLLSENAQAAKRESRDLQNRIRFMEQQQIKLDNGVFGDSKIGKK
ncbi:DUF2968 domain-containing protein [Collimonas sp.]|uniref:DUF2968 domain-containing protein n=1 Tax=Collimonas sp. TaxID=1963772 RepID=UPI002B9301B1|nr:DUF2968 domain-containing protein [Collimonas sp.]HWW06676.1 DUF2968 domain-containing protein [Collimonas sp.]